jgi:PAS domain S-box-containing protein
MGGPLPLDEGTAHLRGAVRAVALAILAVGNLAGLANAFGSSPGERFSAALLIGFGTCVPLSTWLLTRLGRLQAAASILVLVPLGVTLAVTWVGYGLRDVGIIGFPLVIVAAGLLLDGRRLALVVALSMASVLLLAWGHARGWIFLPSSNAVSRVDIVSVLVVILGVGLFVRLLMQAFHDSLARAVASEKRYRTLVDHAPEAILVVDPERCAILHANPNAALMFDCAREELEGPLTGDLVPKSQPDGVDSAEAIERLLAEAMAGETSVVEFFCRKRGGISFPCEVRVVRLPSDGPPLVRISLIDISERVRLQERLRQTEKMAAIGALLAGVAHEVRNPLFGISSTLDTFEMRYQGNEDAVTRIGSMRSQVGRLAELMRDLLDFGRPSGLKSADCELREVVWSAASGCVTPASARGVAIDVAQGPPVTLVGDRGRLAQVFRNLIENAVEFSAPGSQVRIEIAPDAGARRAGGVEVRVLDRGPGFAQADLPRLFEPFFTRRREGTGLGLSIVKRIVEDHGGEVEARNRPEGGAEVRVRLPRAGLSAPPPPLEDASS